MRASPTRRGPPSSGPCPPWVWAGSAGCGPGKSFRFDIAADDEASALAQATVVADRLLANPVIEESSVTVSPAVAGAVGSRA